MLTLTYFSFLNVNRVKATPTNGNIIWTQTNNPSTNNAASGVAVDGTGVYVVGYDLIPDLGNAEWRMEKRSLITGAVTWTQTENPSAGDDQAKGVAVDGTGVYVVGFDYSAGNLEWRVEKRSLTTGAVTWTQTENPSAGGDQAFGVAVDGTGVYVVGGDNVPGGSDYEWRVEKRSLTTGALIPTFGSAGVVQENPSAGSDSATGVAVDAAGVYVVGSDASPGNLEWRVEKCSLTTGALIPTFGSAGVVQENPSVSGDQAFGVAVDATGVYVVGFDYSAGYTWRVEKRSLTTGALIPTFGSAGVVQENPSTYDVAQGVAVDATGVYVVGVDNSPGNAEWRIEKRSLITGAVTWTQTENPSAGNNVPYGVAVDATGVYVVGIDHSPGNLEWRMEKRNPGLPLWIVGIQLVGGWNLVSLPVVPVSSVPNVLLAQLTLTATVGIVWSFTGTPTPTWKFYNPKTNTGTLTSITDGMGLWIYMTDPGVLNVEGYVIPPAATAPQYSLVAGWNLVGYKPSVDATSSEFVSVYIRSLPPGSYDQYSIRIYVSSTGTWLNGTSTMLSPGQAFWIRMLSTATLSP